MMIDKNQDDTELNKDDDESGQGSPLTNWIPGFSEFVTAPESQEQLKDLVTQALFDNRIKIKAQGHKVQALEKTRKLHEQLAENLEQTNSQSGQGLNLEEHPELPIQDGMINPDNVVLPESEDMAVNSNNPQIANRLKNKIAAKFGLGKGVSLESLREEHKKKMRARAQPKPQERPRYRPATPKPSGPG